MSKKVDTIASILKERCKSLRQLKHIHAHIIQSDLHRNNLLCSTLVFSYASLSSPRYTNLVFHSISRPNLFVFNHTIRAFSKVRSLCTDSLRMYVRMVCCGIRPDNFTFPYLLNACAALGAIMSGVEVHGRVVKTGFGLCLPVMNALVDMYGKCGEVGNAHQLFDEMHVRDVVSCNAVLGAFGRCGKDMESALKVFDGMAMRNVISWNAMIVGYVNAGDLGLARDFFDRMVNLKDVVSWTTMLVGYTKNGLIDMATDLFKDMPQKSTVAWTAMVSGCTQNGRPKEALSCFRKMLKENVKPDAHTMTSVISALAQLGRPDLANWIKDYIESENIDLNERVLTALIDMYAKCGNLKEACRLFEEIPCPDVFPYSALIMGLASHGQGHEALDVFQKMKAGNVQPDHITFVGVFTACGHTGLVEDGMKFWASMIEDYGIEPDADHYGCIVDMFGRAGRLDEAYEFIKSMPMGPKQGALGALLAACRTYGNVEIAETVADRLFELEPVNTGNYVLLSSIYAQREEWDNAARVREMIKDRSIVKLQGSSWVEINRKELRERVSVQAHHTLKESKKMLATALPSIHDGKLMIRGKVVLTEVPSNIVVSQASDDSAFLGATSACESSRHVLNLGVLKGYKLLCLYRFKIWWMIPRVGSTGSDIPIETQFLLLEAMEESSFQDDSYHMSSTMKSFYILVLPTLEGSFRSSLQGTELNELQLCVESGDANVRSSTAIEAVLINSGDDPFDLIRSSIKILEKCKGTFSHIENKKIPAHLDWFGWCTWDAFYKDVSPQGIIDGLQSFQEGGCMPRFLIIDDGWQDTVNEFQKEGEPAIEGSEFAIRLRDIKENKKFKDLETFSDLQEFVKTIKEKYGLKFVYMWHALAGYWGGVLPSSEAMKKYNPKLVYPIQSPGNIGNLRDIAMDSIEKLGVGFIDPKHIYEFYDDLHSYLKHSGADGVKVDVQNLIETLGSGYGGRVEITRHYQGALEQSVSKNFKDNNLICCMSHNSDCIYSSKMSAVARASEDFMPNEPTFHTLHIASVSFNSLLLGEIVVPDWDMFHSNHGSAEFHGIARALGGCAVYVSDKPGTQDFKILKKLVLPDGFILRAQHAGRPTRDCLFVDPVMDGKSLLKIWNTNKHSGVLGVFNCQGAGRWPSKDKHQQSHQQSPYPASTSFPLRGHVTPLDVEHLEGIAGENWHGDSAIYAFNSGSVSRLSKHDYMEISLEILKCEIFTISPIKVFNPNIHFAPLGLLDMYNSGGAIEALSSNTYDMIIVKARGCGRFGSYSSKKPKLCKVDSQNQEFTYNAENGLLTINIEGNCHERVIEIIY